MNIAKGKDCIHYHHPDGVRRHKSFNVLGRSGANVVGEAAKVQGCHAKAHTDLPPMGSCNGARSILRPPVAPA